MGLYSVNKIKLSIEDYRQYWLGTPGIGKTTMFRDMIMEEYGDPESGLLISTGNETGYKSLDNINVAECETWAKFLEVVDDLVENKSNNHIKILAIDTVDELVYIAEQYTLQVHRNRNNGESAVSIKAALGGYGAGAKFAREQIIKQISRLERSGYGIVYIGHTKYRDLTDGESEQTYQMLTTNMDLPYHAIFSNRCDVMGMMYVKRVIKNDKLFSEKRLIRFRGNTTIECKSKISNFPEEIEFDVKLYLKTFKEALEELAGVSGKEAEQQRKQDAKNRDEKSKEFLQKEKQEKEDDSLLNFNLKLVEIAQGLSSEDRVSKKSELEKANLPASPKSFREIEDMEIARKVHKILTN